MYMIMRKGFVTIILLLSAGVAANMAVAQSIERHGDREHIEDMLERNRWGDARVELQEFIEGLDPVYDYYEQGWAEYQMVRSAVGLGDVQTESLMLDYIESYPEGAYTNTMRYLLASHYCDKRDLKRAEEHFAMVSYKALDATQQERYDIRMGYIEFVDGDYRAAKKCFERIGRRSLYRPHAQYYLSYIDYVEGRNDEAREGFASLRSHDSYRALVPFYLLQIDYREGKYDSVIREGEALFESAAATTRDDLSRIIAESYFIKGDYGQALRYIMLYPEGQYKRQEHYIRGYSLYRLGRYKEAVEPLKRVCGAEDALTQNASYHLADCYLRMEDKSHAADAFAIAAVEGFNDDMSREALYNYGRLKYELGGGRFNEAVNILNEYLHRYPGTEHESEVKQLLIAAYYNSRDYAAAYAAIHEFDNPDREIRAAHQRVALHCAVDAVERRDWESAELYLAEAEQIALTPKYNALTLYWQGEVAYAQGDMERAAERYEAYIRRAPKGEVEYAYAHYGLGYARFTLGDMAAAAKAFESFTRAYNTKDSYLYDGYNRLGDARFAVREFGKARNAYNVAVRSTGAEHHYADYQLAMVDGIEAKTASKIERLRAIVSDGRGDYVDDAWYELGHTYITSERYAEGATTLSSFVKENRLSPYYIAALSELGLAYYNLDRRDDARRCYEEVVAYDPQSSAAMEAMRGIREIFISEGNVDGYFAYAERSGVQSDMSAAARDSLSFAAAKNLYLDGKIGTATEKLEGYLASFERGYNRSEALYYLADCRMQSGENGRAIAAMEELLGHGQTQYTERVLRVLAPMAYDEGEYHRSAEAYRRLCGEASEQQARSNASEGYVDAALRTGDEQLIAAMTEYIPAMADATPWAKRQAKLAKAHRLRREGDAAAAEELYAELAAERKSEEGAEAYYYLVAARYAAGDYSGVEQMIYDMGECGSMYWQAKAFLVLGDALVKMDNTFQARATYQSIVDGYSPKDDGIVAEAKGRIAAL